MQLGMGALHDCYCSNEFSKYSSSAWQMTLIFFMWMEIFFVKNFIVYIIRKQFQTTLNAFLVANNRTYQMMPQSSDRSVK